MLNKDELIVRMEKIKPSLEQINKENKGKKITYTDELNADFDCQEVLAVPFANMPDKMPKSIEAENRFYTINAYNQAFLRLFAKENNLEIEFINKKDDEMFGLAVLKSNKPHIEPLPEPEPEIVSLPDEVEVKEEIKINLPSGKKSKK